MVSFGRYCGKLLLFRELKFFGVNSSLLLTALTRQPKFVEGPPLATDCANACTPVVTLMLSQQISWPMPSAQLLTKESGTEPVPSGVEITSPPGVVQFTLPVLFQVEPISVHALVKRCARITASGT